jgi:hypothetical protein
MFLRGRFDRFLFRTIAVTALVGCSMALWGIKNMALNVNKRERL